jgi:hypothetical protein
VVAWEVARMSRANLKEHVAFGGLDRELKKINDHQRLLHVVFDLSIPRFLPREFVSMHVWRWSEDKQELTTFVDDVEHEGFPRRKDYLRASSTGMLEYKQEARVGGCPQTKITYTQRVDLGGAIPKWVQNRQGVGMLMYVRAKTPAQPHSLQLIFLCRYLSTMRERFDKSLAIDGANQERLLRMIEGHDGDYSAREEEILEEGEKMLEVFAQQKSKELKMPSPATQAKMAFKDGESHAYGWSKATVRASPARVLAFVWDLERRATFYRDDLEKMLDEDGEHGKLFYIKKKVPDPFKNRDFLSRFVWRKRGTGYIVVSVPELSDAHPLASGVVRARYPSVMKVTRTGDGSTQLEYALQPDAGGSLPLWLIHRKMGATLAWVTTIQTYFVAMRALQDLDAKDGEAVGEVLATKTDAEKHHREGETKGQARVRVLMEKHRGLRELGQKHEWFKALLTKIVENKLRPGGDSKAKLCNMSEKEAKVIGGALASCIAANLTAPAAVDEWILRYPAMGELDREYVRERNERKKS